MHTEGKGVRGMKRILVFEFSKNMVIKMQQTQKGVPLRICQKSIDPPPHRDFGLNLKNMVKKKLNLT